MTYSCPDCGTRARCPRCRARTASPQSPTRPEPAPAIEPPPAAATEAQSEPQRPETRRSEEPAAPFPRAVLAELESSPRANQHRASTHTPLPDTLSLAEIADRFGVNYQTARAWRTRGVLPAPDAAHGAYPRWTPALVDEWWRLRQLRLAEFRSTRFKSR